MTLSALHPLLLGTLLPGIVALEPIQDAAAPQQAQMRYRPQVGKTYVYQATSSLDGSIEVSVGEESEPSKIPMKLRIEMEMGLECTASEPRRSDFEQTIRWFRLEGEYPGVNYRFDSRRPEDGRHELLEPFFKALQRMTARPFAFTVAARGGVSYSPAAKELLASISGPISFEQLETILADVFPALPEEPQQVVGGTWSVTRTVELPTIGAIDLATEHHVEAADASGVRIRLAIKPTFEPSGAGITSETLVVKKSGGQATFDAEDGLLRAHESDFHVEFDLSEQEVRLKGQVKLGSSVQRK